jgi:hypothetical protein
MSYRWRDPRERASILQSVTEYLSKRRNGSLFALMAVELELELSRQPDMVLRSDDYWQDPLRRLETLVSTTSDIATVFAEKRHELLILGAPGGGKTTLLLRLCQELVNVAKENTELPLPVLVDLASWSTAGRRRLPNGALSSPRDFRLWLADELKKHYGISLPQTRGLLYAKGKLAVLLDGLDEVNAEDREKCVAEINALREDCGVQIAVCCRTRDYEDLSRRLELYDAVEIGSVQRSKVVDCLDAFPEKLDGVRKALADNPGLWDMLTTPLMFSIMALTFRGSPLSASASVGQLFDAYIVEMLVRRGASPRWTPERVIRALRFLARLASSPLWNDDVARSRLPNRQAWTDFLTPSSMWRLFRRAEPAALIGVLAAFGLVLGLRFGVVVAVGAATCTAVATVMLDWALREVPRCVPEDRSGGWMWAGVGLLGGAVGGVAGYGTGLVVGMVAAWPAFIAYAVTVVLVIVMSALFVAVLGLPLPTASWVAVAALVLVMLFWTNAVEALLIGLGSGVGLGVMLGGLVGGLEQIRQFDTSWPDWTSRLVLPVSVAGVLLGVASAGLLGASDSFAAVPVVGVVLGLSCLPLAATSSGGIALTHYSAELLARPMTLDELPFRRTALLRFAHERILLIKPESEYQFVHRLLRDHLASCDPERLGAEVSRRLNSE